MSKISWSNALVDYLKDETKTYSMIAEKYGISLQSVKKRASKEGWQDLRQKSIQKVNQKLPELVGENVAEINAKHIRVGRFLQGVAVQAMIDKGMKPENFPQALSSLKIGVEIERRAAGLDKETNNAQVSIFTIVENDRQKYGF